MKHYLKNMFKFKFNNNKMESYIIKFYKNTYNANNKKEYSLDQILKWDDYKLEKEHDFIQWLFPDETGGVINGPKLNSNDIEIFTVNQEIRQNVIKAVRRMMLFYGYKLYFKNLSIKQVLKLYRKEKDTIIGLYSQHNYRRLTRMMSFLKKINFHIPSAMILLCLCDAMGKDKKLLDMIIKTDSVKYWIETQEFLNKYNLIDIIKNLKNKKSFQGLKYITNSCYQDSVLLSLFANKNSFINENILEKKINKEDKILTYCGETKDEHFKTLENIQQELLKISQYIQNKNNDTDTCKNLKKFFKLCSRKQFSTNTQQDAGEYLLTIFDIFNIATNEVLEQRSYTNTLEDEELKNWRNSSSIYKKESPIINIHISELDKDKTINLKKHIETEYLIKLTDSYKDPYNKNILYNLQKNKIKILKSEFLVFNVNRNVDYKKVKKYDNIVDFPTSIIISNKILFLYSIIVHKNNHYTAFIQFDNVWYHYDDLKSTIENLGEDLDNVIKHDKNPKQNGTLFFYK